MTAQQIQEVLQSGTWLEPEAWNMRLSQPYHFPALVISESKPQQIFTAYCEAGDTHWRTRRTGSTAETRLTGGTLSQTVRDHGGRLYLISGQDMEKARERFPDRLHSD